MSVINADPRQHQRIESYAARRAGMSFPDMLRSHRLAAGISQSGLAARIEIDHSYVSRLENGSRVPSLEIVWALANEFRLKGPVRFRFFASSGKFERVPHEEQIDLMALVSEMDADGLRAVRAVLAWEIGRQNQHTYAANDGASDALQRPSCVLGASS